MTMNKKDGKKIMQTTTEKTSSWQNDYLRRWQKGKKVSVSQTVLDSLQIRFDGEILLNEPMAGHTYIKIGGPADVFLKPKSVEAIVYAVKLAQENALPLYFHGWGANTLVKDGGLRGLVLCAYDVMKEYRILSDTEDFVDIEADAGLHFSRMVHLAREAGAIDFAAFAGIPGSVGGLVAMNAGTREREIKDVLRSVTVIEKTGELKTISREELEFSYRTLKLPRGTFILKALFRLEKTASREDVEAEIKRFQKRRVDTQPLDYPNLGSIFKNPIPAHKKELGTSAGRLIEEAELKNVRIGGARISPKHANFIINEGGASAHDVISLINLIKDKVKATSGVMLETEIKIVGEELHDNT